MENNDGLITVNGHSHAHKKTPYTNFALLVSKTFTEPFKEPIKYGRYIAGLANLLGGGVLLQRLGDLQAGRRSTPERIKKGLVRPTLKEATPGDLQFGLALPPPPGGPGDAGGPGRHRPGSELPEHPALRVEVKFLLFPPGTQQQPGDGDREPFCRR